MGTAACAPDLLLGYPLALGEDGMEEEDRNAYPSVKVNGWHRGKGLLLLQKTLRVEL